MTALCGGGTSGPKAGVAETVIFTTSSLASVLNNRGGLWATLVAPLLGVVAYQATELCGTDPPADPGMTAADYLHLLRLDDLGAVATATGKLADLAKIAIWYELCQCTAGGTPAAPPAVFLPPDGVYGPQPVASAPCWSASWQGLAPTDADTTPNAGQEINQFLVPDLGTHTTVAPFPVGLKPSILPTPQWERLRVTARVAAGGNVNVRVSVYMFNTAGTGWTARGPIELSQDGSPFPLSGFLEFDTDPAYPRSLLITAQTFGTAAELEVSIAAWCAGAGPADALNPCLADPSSIALLHQIYALLQLVQRQHVPFAYVPGLEYTGLTGQDEIVFSDPILRVQVDLTTLPAHYGFAESDPDVLFDVGRVALGTADGWEAFRAIRHTPFLVNARGDHTRIGYQLSPGVVATIRTFSREP